MRKEILSIQRKHSLSIRDRSLLKKLNEDLLKFEKHKHLLFIKFKHHEEIQRDNHQYLKKYKQIITNLARGNDAKKQLIFEQFKRSRNRKGKEESIKFVLESLFLQKEQITSLLEQRLTQQEYEEYLQETLESKLRTTEGDIFFRKMQVDSLFEAFSSQESHSKKMDVVYQKAVNIK